MVLRAGGPARLEHDPTGRPVRRFHDPSVSDCL